MLEKLIVALGLTNPVAILITLLLIWTWGKYIPQLNAKIDRLEKILEEYNKKFKEEFFDQRD